MWLLLQKKNHVKTVTDSTLFKVPSANNSQQQVPCGCFCSFPFCRPWQPLCTAWILPANSITALHTSSALTTVSGELVVARAELKSYPEGNVAIKGLVGHHMQKKCPLNDFLWPTAKYSLTGHSFKTNRRRSRCNSWWKLFLGECLAKITASLSLYVSLSLSLFIPPPQKKNIQT